jgi:hypothetical protein
MIQVRRIIQLKAEGLSKLKISGSLHIHRSTLDSYLSKLEASGKSYPELLQYSDEQLIALVYNDPVGPKADDRINDLKKHMGYFKAELSRVGVTRKTLCFAFILPATSKLPKPPCIFPIVLGNIFKLILPEKIYIISIYRRVKSYHVRYWYAPCRIAAILM